MSGVALSAVATVPLDCNVEILERRLLELRAQIDAVLTQLASQKVAPPAIEPVGMAEPQGREAIAGPAPAEASLAPAVGEETRLDMAAPAETRPEPSFAGDDAADQPGAVELQPSSPSAPATELSGSMAQASDDLASIASTDADTHLTIADAPVAASAALQAEMQVEPAGDAAALPLTSAVAAQPTSIEPIIVGPTAERAADMPASAGASPDAPAGAQVISFQPRHPKQKAGFATGATVAARPGRRLATKIAACIVALLAAATVLAVTDKAAVGGVQSLPWMPPLPQYMPSGANWSFLGYRQSAGQEVTTSDGSTSPARAAVDDAVLSRYREAWPTGW